MFHNFLGGLYVVLFRVYFRMKAFYGMGLGQMGMRHVHVQFRRHGLGYDWQCRGVNGRGYKGGLWLFLLRGVLEHAFQLVYLVAQFQHGAGKHLYLVLVVAV